MQDKNNLVIPLINKESKKDLLKLLQGYNCTDDLRDLKKYCVPTPEDILMISYMCSHITQHELKTRFEEATTLEDQLSILTAQYFLSISSDSERSSLAVILTDPAIPLSSLGETIAIAYNKLNKKDAKKIGSSINEVDYEHFFDLDYMAGELYHMLEKTRNCVQDCKKNRNLAFIDKTGLKTKLLQQPNKYPSYISDALKISFDNKKSLKEIDLYIEITQQYLLKMEQAFDIRSKRDKKYFQDAKEFFLGCNLGHHSFIREKYLPYAAKENRRETNPIYKLMKKYPMGTPVIGSLLISLPTIPMPFSTPILFAALASISGAASWYQNNRREKEFNKLFYEVRSNAIYFGRIYPIIFRSEDKIK